MFFFKFSGEFVSDFEAMLARKREQVSKRRKRRDIDIINDNDDIIDQLIQNMRLAAEVIFTVKLVHFECTNSNAKLSIYRKIVN